MQIMYRTGVFTPDWLASTGLYWKIEFVERAQDELATVLVLLGYGGPADEMRDPVSNMPAMPYTWIDEQLERFERCRLTPRGLQNMLEFMAEGAGYVANPQVSETVAVALGALEERLQEMEAERGAYPTPQTDFR